MNDTRDFEEYKNIIKTLETAGKVEPDQAFKAAARERILAQIDAAAEPQGSAKVIRFGPRRFWVRTLAATAALALVMTSVSFASTDSLPGDTLYPVKRAVETGGLLLARNDEAKANVYLDLAERRRAEADRLIGAKRLARLDQTLQDMSNETELANTKVGKVSENKREALLVRLDKQVAAEQQLLDKALKNPAKAQAALERARQRVIKNRTRVKEAVDTAQARREQNRQQRLERQRQIQKKQQQHLNRQPMPQKQPAAEGKR